MSNKNVAILLLLAFVAATPAFAATAWNSKDYDLYAGDFNGDGYQDVLYVALSPSGESGIALSNGNELLPGLQTWNSGGLGVTWHSRIYLPVIGDFNWDGRSDIFMHRQTPGGDHYLLLSNADGTFTGIAQTITNSYAGYVWSADEHKVLSIAATGSDPAHPKGHRLMLQATKRAGTNVIVATNNTQRITTTILKSWQDGYLGFQWNAAQAVLHTGDFNLDGEGDLLIQAKPDIVLIDYDVQIPVPRYRPGSFGIAYSPVTLSTYVAWDRKRAGVDWSATSSNLTILDANGDGRSDVLVQPRTSGSSVQLVYANQTSSQLDLDTPSAVSFAGISDVGGGAYRIVAANINGGPSGGVYLQAATSSGTDYIVHGVSAGSMPGTAVTAQAQSGAWVGTVPGAGGVSATGAATYSIPIQVPAGINGLEPRLSFEYNHTAGNGILGVGWRVGGLSAITRCNKTFEQDTAPSAPFLAATDAYCIDGNRLVLKTGTYGDANAEYGTEVETFSKIVAVNPSGDALSSWLVYGRDGLIYEYGATEDSRIQTVGTSIARLWALNKVRDRNGNYISYTYQETDGSYRPLEVGYTGNPALAPTPATKVQFVYEGLPRADKIYRYRHGYTGSALAGIVNEFHRLIGVEIVSAATLSVVRKYSIAYEPTGSAGPRSRISGISLCAGSTCVPATTLQWINGTPSWNSNESSVTQSAPGKVLVGDINGDGRDDMVVSSSATSGSGTWYYMLGSSTGLGPPTDSTRINYNQSEAQIIEFNGDGMADILVPCDGVAKWCVLRANGSGFNAPFNTQASSVGSNGLTLAADVDGDGLDDLVRQSTPNTLGVRTGMNGVGFGPEYTAWTAEFGNLTFYTGFGDATDRGLKRRMDLNGDGREDFTLVLKYDEPEPEHPDFFYLTTFFGLGAQISRGSDICAQMNGMGCFVTSTGDVNGDGLSDIVIRDSNQAYSVRVGTGGDSAQLFLSTLGGTPQDLSYGTMLLDYDGDGLDDLLIAKNYPNTTWYLSRSTGNGLQLAVDTGLSASPGVAGSNYGADVNGDGLGDIVRTDSGFVRARLHNGVYPDLLDRVTDGAGMFVDFDYVSLPNAGSPLYTNGTDSMPAGAFHYKGPRYIVSSQTLSDGLNGSFATNFEYKQSRFDRLGSGFLGFRQVTATDMRNNVRTETVYKQTPGLFATLGATEKMLVKQSDGTPISETTNTWNISFVNGRTAAYLGQQVVKQYEMEGPQNGQLITTTTTDNLFDGATGTIYDSTRKVVEASGANGIQSGVEYKQRVVHPLANLLTDTANWCLGLPQRTEYTNSHTQDATEGAQQTRVVTRTWDTKCRLTAEAVEPSNAPLRVDVALTYDDGPGEGAPDFGNLVKVGVTGAGMTERATRSAFTADGRFVQSITNALGQITQIASDPKLGVPLTVTDPNQLQLTWEYDALGRRIKETRPDGTSTRWLLRRCLASSCLSDPLLRSYVRTQLYGSDAELIRTDDQYFDGASRLKYQDSASLLANVTSRVEYRYDAFGHVLQQSSPYFVGNTAYWQTFTYDLAGRVKTMSRPVSASDSTPQTATMYYEGLTTRVEDAQSKIQKQILNAAGLVARSIDHNGYYQTFAYDRFANLVQASDSQSSVLQTMSYNIRGMKTGQTDADAGTWGYQSNALGELEYIRDAKTTQPAWTTHMQYDALGRMTSRQDIAEGVTSTFEFGAVAADHNIGRLRKMEAPGYSETYLYDDKGRLQKTTINNGNPFDMLYEYNTLGLLDKLTYPTTLGNPLAVRYEYANGLPKSITEVVTPGTPTVFWNATEADAFGNVTKETLGNQLQTTRAYDALTGWLSSIQTGATGSPTSIQNLNYSWDRVGNLLSRTDSRQNITEDFYYDDLYRLNCSTLNVPRSSCAALSGAQKNLDQTYQANGNIAWRAGIGNYTYHATKVHAVTAAGSSFSYGYDNNGNANARNGNAVSWYSYNLPNTISGGSGNQSQFFYTPDRQRWKQVGLYGGTQEETLYIGGLVEKATIGANVSWKHYIVGPTGPVAVHIRSGATQATHYLTKDHVGSIDSITDSSGAAEVRLSFASFGARRGEAGWTGNPTTGDWTQITGTTRHGFTVHEMLDNLNLTHMNGRVYDQLSGRFLSADPFVTQPGSTQSFNRYSYVYNNPLSYTDPSGFDPDDDDAPGLDPCRATPFCHPRPPSPSPEPGFHQPNCRPGDQACLDYWNCSPPGGCAPRTPGKKELPTGQRVGSAVDPVSTAGGAGAPYQLRLRSGRSSYGSGDWRLLVHAPADRTLRGRRLKGCSGHRLRRHLPVNADRRCADPWCHGNRHRPRWQRLVASIARRHLQ
jgi:RHS repeat-associated protein